MRASKHHPKESELEAECDDQRPEADVETLMRPLPESGIAMDITHSSLSNRQEVNQYPKEGATKNSYKPEIH